jgi:hypothetical protein
MLDDLMNGGVLGDGGAALLEVVVDEGTGIAANEGFGFSIPLDDRNGVRDGARNDRDDVGERLFTGEANGGLRVVQGAGDELSRDSDGCAQHSDSVEGQGSDEKSC